MQEIYIIKKSSYNIIQLFKLLLFILYLGHIFACLLLYVGITNHEKGENNWLRTYNLLDKSWHVQFINAYYFSVVTMCTIGYGDITPQAL